MYDAYASLFAKQVSVSLGDQSAADVEARGVDPSLSLIGSASIYPAPVRRAGIIERLVEDGKASLFMHAPSELVFALQPGRHEVSATFGMRSDALDSPSCEPADGIAFWIGYADGRQLYTRQLDPFSNAADRGAQRVQGIAFSTERPDHLAVRVLAGRPGANTACDWGYVRDVQITPVGVPPAPGAD